jgi:hypothetical protein
VPNRPGQIRKAAKPRKDSVVGAFELTQDQNAEPGKVLLDSIRRFKGLERPVVVLTEIDELAPEDENGMLYVALSPSIHKFGDEQVPSGLSAERAL